jgi:hypothetical protein
VHQWLRPVILATQETEITKKGLVEWFKVKALTSTPQYHTHTQNDTKI